MTASHHIILAAGGTGGHMVPAEALADALIARGQRVSLVTDLRGDAYRNIMNNISRLVLRATSHMRGGVLGKFGAVVSIVKSVFAVRTYYKAEGPALIVGFGGYPSLPAIIAARTLSLPFILHEQNAVLGRVNRWCAGGASALALSDDQTARLPEGVKTFVTGNPVRSAIRAIAGQAYDPSPTDGTARLFILGGSQGAHILSKIVPAAFEKLPSGLRRRLHVTHQARQEDIDQVIETYAAIGVRADVRPYFEDVAAILERTHLVISRSGASTLAELKATGRPAILVPLAIAADDHQSANASGLQASGAATVFAEHAFSPEQLARELEELLTSPARLAAMADAMAAHARLDAAEKLADLVMETIDTKNGAFEAPAKGNER